MNMIVIEDDDDIFKLTKKVFIKTNYTVIILPSPHLTNTIIES
jgi:DNA-binding response OmpR family regulator